MAKNTVKQDEKIVGKSKLHIILRLLDYLKPFKRKVSIVILFMLFVMVCNLLNPYFLKLAIDKYVMNKNIEGLVLLAAGLLVLNYMAMLASKYRIGLMGSVSNQILLDIRQELYSHIQKLSFHFFDNRPVGKVLARVIGDVNALQDLFTNSVTNFIPEILTLVCVTIVMFFLHVKLAIAAVILLPVLMLSMFAIETISRRRWQMYRQKRSTLNAYTHEDFSGIRVVQAFGVEGKTSQSFVELMKELMQTFMQAVRCNDMFWPLVELSWGMGSLIVFWIGARLIDEKSLTVGTLFAFTGYIGMFWRPIMNISNFYNTLITNFAAAERIFEILDLQPDIISHKYTQKMPKIKGHVEFKNVTFGYDANSIVLDGVSFKVKPGETIALVGPTGAGKTTIVNLISRFYDVTEGEVFIDGKNVQDVELESLRSQMGIMLQDTFLFSTTIMENIRYGRLDAADEEVVAAAKAVNAHDFIMGLEKGYATEVSERGSRLSVGQRQLISFARALLASPRILILDEATSNIDTFTEKLVQQGIQKLLYGRTSFVIAHRLSTIRDADRIMVVNEGQIQECGSHEELMEKKGFYYNLYMTQYKFLGEGA